METLTPLQIAQEAYINLFKAEYGVKPRNIDEKLWNDLAWVESQLSTFGNCELPEPVELGYFEEILESVKPEDFDY